MNIRIAIISLSNLESYALRAIFEDYVMAKVETFGSFTEIGAEFDCFDLFVASADAVLESLDILMPRKSRVLVVSRKEKLESSAFNTISVNSDDAELRLAVETLIKGRKRGEVSNQLSAREIEVLKELASGKTQKEIADSLCISSSTVITHRKNISAKLGIRSVSGLSLYALMNGIL